MSKANEFQIYANEFLTWAHAADTQEKRKQFLNLARSWMQAAAQEDRGNASLNGLHEVSTAGLGRRNDLNGRLITMPNNSIDPLKAPTAGERPRADTHGIRDKLSLRNVRLGRVQTWLFMTVTMFVVGILLFGIPAP